LHAAATIETFETPKPRLPFRTTVDITTNLLIGLVPVIA
jgi:hypothetical protein